MPEHETPVLVVGGSLVGMFAAALLARHGIAPLVVERHPGAAIHPRAAMIYQRTMEIIRALGIEDPVRQESYRRFEPDGAIMSVESIAGDELNWDIPTLNEFVKDLSPAERLFITQNALEPMLGPRAQSLGADIRFNTELVAFAPDANGVSAVIRDRATKDETRVRASYLIGADGNRSVVRQQLGIPMGGRGVLSKSITIYFRADIGPLMRGRNLSVIMVRNERFRGFFRLEKPFESAFLVVNSIGDPKAPVSDTWTLSETDCLALVKSGLGVDTPVTIDSIQKWECMADVADRFREDRVFLAGDSAHLMPPYGGFGGNTGIQDAQNLAWKLALVLKGVASPALLDTYESERRPVAAMTAEQAHTRYVLRGAPHLAPNGTAPFINDAHIDLGYRYRSAAIFTEPGDDGAITEDPRQMRGRPGTRLPHVVLERGGSRVSSIDLVDSGFALFAGAGGREWAAAADRAARDAGIGCQLFQLGATVNDPDRGFCDAIGITPSGAVLVRPDGVVAWRATDAGTNPAATMARVFAAMLGRTTV
ncbi:MAG TPA: FAD-dependent monooxygenase [Vicinamibacterales bacterium]|jgi:2-polyprenyl-6-methoxyphenol hydroxylase-like FAD-dependent oxidoreductase|nr:FAD-dependent monooxygenase [Vicinamibacterales bacterium]